MQPTMTERLSSPDAVDVDAASVEVIMGRGLSAYPQLGVRYARAVQHPGALPHAREMALLAVPEVRAGRTQRAQDASPVYLRDQVVATR